MKITILKKIPDNFEKPFAIYEYSEKIARYPGYIDIRGIVKENSKVWLDQLQISHARLSEKFLRYTRWWWTASMSRLDARPWGQENLFKPLFFALALLRWIKANSDINEIFLAGCDPMLNVYLKELDKNLIFNNRKHIFQFFFFALEACKYSVLAMIKMFYNTAHILRYHTFRNKNFLSSDVLVIYELFLNTLSLREARKYFYSSLFNSFSIGRNTISYACIENSGCDVNKLRKGKEDSIFLLFDNTGLGDLAVGLLINIYFFFIMWFVAFSKVPCKIAGYTSRNFWGVYLSREVWRKPILNSFLIYRAIKSIFKHNKYKIIIYPYEEKGIERGILFAAHECNIATKGYAQHPQHALTLALRNTYKPYPPKPSSYAVCGPAYVDYFVKWGKKDRNSISVWGSEKAFREKFKPSKLSRSNLNILLLTSHPNELRVFYSWLASEKRIINQINYLARIYKSVPHRGFSSGMKSFFRDFDCVKESHGDMVEDLADCDLALFCATSAGLVAVNYGRLAIHISIDDFFQVNPCFDDLDAMLTCASASELANRLDEVCSMNNESIAALYKKQRAFAEQIFSPIQSETIKREILC